MVPVRLRHPRGVTTLDINPETQTLDDLRAILFSTTEIPPAQQELKYGYPPKPIPTGDPSSPLASIPIGRGEQIIVTALQASSPASAAPIPTPVPSSITSIKQQNERISAPSPAAKPLPVASELDVESPAESSHSVRVPGGEDGYLQLRVVPDDNSCLFSAVALVFEGGMEGASELRRVVADAIRDDPENYSDVMLGSSRQTYIQKITQPETWGGAIELSIFAKHYKTEISSFDVITGRCDRFGQDEYDTRCILVYSGIHYDAVSLSPLPVSPPSFHTTVFPISSENVMTAARQLVSRLKDEHYYTDTASFDLRCGVCGVGLKGESGAREHARQTGHVEFGEY